MEKSCFLHREAGHWHAPEILDAEKKQLEARLAASRLAAVAAQSEKTALEARVAEVEKVVIKAWASAVVANQEKSSLEVKVLDLQEDLDNAKRDLKTPDTWLRRAADEMAELRVIVDPCGEEVVSKPSSPGPLTFTFC